MSLRSLSSSYSHLWNSRMSPITCSAERSQRSQLRIFMISLIKWATRPSSLRILSISDRHLHIACTATSWTSSRINSNKSRGRTKSKRLSSVSWTRSNAASLAWKNPLRKTNKETTWLKKTSIIRILIRSGTNLISFYSCPSWSTSDRSPCDERPWVRATWFHAVRSAWENPTMRLWEWIKPIRRMIKETMNICRGFSDRALKRTTSRIVHQLEGLPERAGIVLRTSL